MIRYTIPVPAARRDIFTSKSATCSKCASHQAACTFSTAQLPNVTWIWCVFYALTSQCASWHYGALLRHCDFQKWFIVFQAIPKYSEPGKPRRRAIFHLSSGQVTPHFFAPTALASLHVNPPEPHGFPNHWKKCFATFLPFRAFSRSWIFIHFLFTSLTLPTAKYMLISSNIL